MGPRNFGHALNRIISGSPRLEKLKLSSFTYNGDIDIKSISLKKLKFNMFGFSYYERPVLGIWAPNLLTLKIWGCVHVTSSWDVPSLTDGVLCFRLVEERRYFSESFNHVFLSLRHVEKITLSDWCSQVN